MRHKLPATAIPIINPVSRLEVVALSVVAFVFAVKLVEALVVAVEF